jgi:hypothetical protein
MRSSILRHRLAGCSLVGDDLPYLSHTVTLTAVPHDDGGPDHQVVYGGDRGRCELALVQEFLPHMPELGT